MLKNETAKKLEKLRKFVGSFNNVLIALSGGVDSGTLTAICREEIEDVLAVTVRTKATPSREIDTAKKIALELGVKHEVIELDIFKISGFIENSKERCYYCKKEMLRVLVGYAKNKGYEIVFEGTNSSDLRGDRPGFRAVLEEKKVISPWAKFGVEKDEIREIARHMNLSFHDLPSTACLATRIPYGLEITAEALEKIDKAENEIIRLFNPLNVRVRYINGVGILELETEKLQSLSNKIYEIREILHKLGFHSVLLDLDGYKEGGVEKYSTFLSKKEKKN
ncbi:MAG: ATP-dependent sacrificial sulfur transferase LarE [Archaeoglobaceae archaeon]|nr:ATP-dependent sacrificial sulfur transferase LarE [Archaeoglobaceae archaeon]